LNCQACCVKSCQVLSDAKSLSQTGMFLQLFQADFDIPATRVSLPIQASSLASLFKSLLQAGPETKSSLLASLLPKQIQAHGLQVVGARIFPHVLCCRCVIHNDIVLKPMSIQRGGVKLTMDVCHLASFGRQQKTLVRGVEESSSSAARTPGKVCGIG